MDSDWSDVERRGSLRWLSVYLLAHCSSEFWFVVSAPWAGPRKLLVGCAVALSLCLVCVLAVRDRARLLCGVMGAILLLYLVSSFPSGPNHLVLELLATAALATYDICDPDESRELLWTLRAIVTVALVGSGMQKVLHGTYFQGTYLAFAVAHSQRFATSLGLLMPSTELDRLRGLGEVYRAGGGPYRFDSPVMLALSNTVYVAELVLPTLLWWRRTRRAASWLALGFVACLEAGAQEFFFGALMVSLLGLFGAYKHDRACMCASLLLLAWATFERHGLITVLGEVN